jgi:proline racemase
MHIPRTTPTRIHIDKTIGGVNVRGFMQDGRDYVNYAPGATPALDIDIQVGVGEVTLDTTG